MNSTANTTGRSMNDLPHNVPFFDFSREIAASGADLEQAAVRVLRSGRYILGEEVAAFEREFAGFCHVPHALGVASGTDALFLTLKAWGIGPGDEVITVANTFAATALAICYTGATPVFVDIDPDTLLMDVDRVAEAITSRTKAVIPVHLYGRCAEMDPLMALAEQHGLKILEDACQAHGARYRGRPTGSLGHAAAFSFYPTKNLGAVGDGGMITTASAELHEQLTLWHNYGQRDRYRYDLAGYNSRLDELQAAVLRAKLPLLDDRTSRRQHIAARYDKALEGINLAVSSVPADSTHVYHLYVIAVPERDELMTFLKDRGVGTLIHYPVPLHEQQAFAGCRVAGELPHTLERCGQIVSLPMHPWLTDDEVDHVASCIREFYR